MTEIPFQDQIIKIVQLHLNKGLKAALNDRNTFSRPDNQDSTTSSQ